MLKLAADCFPVAAFLHTLVTLWSFGNQNVFPSDFSWLHSFFGWLIGQNEDDYLATTMDFHLSSDLERSNLFGEYVHARMLDMSRGSCWLLLCIFLVFLAYYAVAILIRFLLYPLLKPFLVAVRGWCCAKLEEDTGKMNLEEATPGMVAKGLRPSYAIRSNPQYSVLLHSLAAGHSEVSDAIAEHAVSRAAKNSRASSRRLTGAIGRNSSVPSCVFSAAAMNNNQTASQQLPGAAVFSMHRI